MNAKGSEGDEYRWDTTRLTQELGQISLFSPVALNPEGHPTTSRGGGPLTRRIRRLAFYAGSEALPYDRNIRRLRGYDEIVEEAGDGSSERTVTHLFDKISVKFDLCALSDF